MAVHALLALALPLGVTGCGDDIARPAPFEGVEIGVVVNSVELSLTIFSSDDPSERTTIGLGAGGSPVGIAVRGERGAVPMGSFPAVVVVDLQEGTVIRTVGLPEGSGASGVAFLNDSIVLVGNPQLNSLSPVNILSGVAGEPVAVGVFPQRILVHEERVYVLNAELGEDFQPARSGTVTVLNGADLSPRGTIDLTGENPGAVAVGSDGLLYVLNAGRFFEGTGSLSIVDPLTETEIAHHEGFGDFPGAAAFSPGGVLHVSSFSYGIATWDPANGSFVRSPQDAIEPGGVAAAAGLGFDSAGRLHTLLPECADAASVFRLTPAFELEVEIPVGICPLAVAFTRIGIEMD